MQVVNSFLGSTINSVIDKVPRALPSYIQACVTNLAKTFERYRTGESQLNRSMVIVGMTIPTVLYVVYRITGAIYSSDCLFEARSQIQSTVDLFETLERYNSSVALKQPKVMEDGAGARSSVAGKKENVVANRGHLSTESLDQTNNILEKARLLRIKTLLQGFSFEDIREEAKELNQMVNAYFVEFGKDLFRKS